MNSTSCWFLATLLLLGTACARAPLWVANDEPTLDNVAVLLEADPLAYLSSEPLPSEVPEVPIRERLRPCCAFGTDLRVRVGAVPVPGFRIGNIIGVKDLGPHAYDSGAFTRSS